MAESKFDVIVVGGGPIGLAAAYYCAKKRKKVLVLEQFTFGNANSSSPGYSRQFRICYAEEHLTRLAITASDEWDQLMLDFNDFTLMERTGTLWFGDPNSDSGASGEGNIEDAAANLKKYDQAHTTIESFQVLNELFPFVAKAVENVEDFKAMFVPNGGTVNVPGLVQCLLKGISEHKGCTLLQNIRVSSIDYSQPEEIMVTTNDGKVFCGEKVILTPGTYINFLLSTLKPAYDQLINLDIYLWSSTYFKVSKSGHPSPTTWPTWYFFGNSKNESSTVVDGNLYYGFPIEHPTPGCARVAPAFISEDSEDSEKFRFHLFPKDVKDRPLDRNALKFTSNFVENVMDDLDHTSVEEEEATCLAGFAIRSDGSADDSGGIVLDFLPGD